MLSKYAQAYTKLTKRQIKKQGRDGRHFTAEQREVMKNARDLVRSQTGTTVEDAMKRALVFDSAALEVESWGDTTGFDLVALKQALSEAVTLPLVKEIQGLKAEIADLKQGQDSRDVRQIEKPAQRKENHGALVRFALWVESFLRR
jgi:hypothetical protein